MKKQEYITPECIVMAIPRMTLLTASEWIDDEPIDPSLFDDPDDPSIIFDPDPLITTEDAL
jgi:hypothetical protein